MNLHKLFINATKVIKSNSPEILTALGVTGVVATSYLTGKASFTAADHLNSGIFDHKDYDFKEKVKIVWKYYIPAALTGSITIGCIIGASKSNSRRTAAAVTAYSLTERAFSEYKEKVVEQIGKGKEQKIRDGLAQEQVSKKNGSNEVIVLGTGHVLCCELYTNRYFRSDIEKIRKIVNEINAKIISEVYVSMDEFYDRLGLSYTSISNNMGWDSNKLLELQFSTVLSEDGEPCLAFDYNYTKPLK